MGAGAFPFPAGCAAPLPAFAVTAWAAWAGGAAAGVGLGRGAGAGIGLAPGRLATLGAVRSMAGPAFRGSGVGDSESVVSVIVWLCRSHWPEAYGEISPYE